VTTGSDVHWWLAAEPLGDDVAWALTKVAESQRPTGPVGGGMLSGLGAIRELAAAARPTDKRWPVVRTAHRPAERCVDGIEAYTARPPAHTVGHRRARRAAAAGPPLSRPGPRRSHGELAADGGALVTANLTTRRTRGLALAALAACSSSAYDEAFSIGTAFLAGGTQSVISALWKAPDADTSALMSMFHHFPRKLPPDRR
jgi:hypothetical protein